MSKNHQTLFINEYHLSRKESKKRRNHVPGSDINILSDDFVNELQQLETYEHRLLQKQHEDKNQTLMYILDLLFYFLFSLPYTIMRLILDLFVKDQVKTSLDFFILYKTSLLAFHIHLIAKFFLMLTLNAKFRQCLASAFSFRNNSGCCSRNKEHNTTQQFGYASNNRREKNRDDADGVCCYCCQGYNRRVMSPTDSNLDGDINLYNSYSVDDENFYHSTEFNSNYHQFFCPAEPTDSDLVFNLPPNLTTTTTTKSKFSFDEQCSSPVVNQL